MRGRGFPLTLCRDGGPVVEESGVGWVVVLSALLTVLYGCFIVSCILRPLYIRCRVYFMEVFLVGVVYRRGNRFSLNIFRLFY